MADKKPAIAVRSLGRAIHRSVKAGQIRTRADVHHTYDLIAAPDLIEEAIEYANQLLTRDNLPRI